MTDFHVPPESDREHPAGISSDRLLDQYRNHGGQADRLSYDLAGGGHFALVKADIDAGGTAENPARC
jgi:hypothetical protein